YKIIAPSKETAQLFPFNVRYVDTLQPPIFQFPAYKLGIDLIGLGKALLSLAVDVCRIDHEGSPSILFETAVRIIAATASFISRGNFVIGKMFCTYSSKTSGRG